jgi:hypothetical protein
MDTNKPNVYTFAKAMQKKLGCSYHAGVTFGFLSMMPAHVQRQYGEGKLTGNDVLRLADQMDLPGTRVRSRKQ